MKQYHNIQMSRNLCNSLHMCLGIHRSSLRYIHCGNFPDIQKNIHLYIVEYKRWNKNSSTSHYNL